MKGDRQQNYALAVHAINHSSNAIINQCGGGWGGFEGAGSWAMRILGVERGGGTMGVDGGEVKMFFECKHNPLRYCGILCMGMILSQATDL